MSYLQIFEMRGTCKASVLDPCEAGMFSLVTPVASLGSYLACAWVLGAHWCSPAVGTVITRPTLTATLMALLVQLKQC